MKEKNIKQREVAGSNQYNFLGNQKVAIFRKQKQQDRKKVEKFWTRGNSLLIFTVPIVFVHN